MRPWLAGKVLDVGCGSNELLVTWKDGVGVDVYPWEAVDIIVDSSNLPFGSGSFDTVCCIATLNHIPRRKKALREMHRVLKLGGLLLVTMINPVIGWVCHHLLPGEESHTRGMAPGEWHGIWSREIIALVARLGFDLEKAQSFGLFRLNTLYVFRKAERKTTLLESSRAYPCERRV